MKSPLMRFAIGLCFLISVAKSLRLNHEITPDVTEENKWVWSFFIAIGCFGVIYNGLVIAMLLLMKNKKSFSFYSLNVCYNLNDLIYSLERVLFGSLQFMYGRKFEEDDTACFLDALSETFHPGWSVLILVGISWVVRYDIVEGKRFSERNMWLYCLSVGVYCFGICVMLAKVWGYRLEASGTYCLTPQYTAQLWLYAACNVSIPRLFLIYNLKVTNKIIKKAQLELEAQGIQEKAKGHYIKMVKKLNIFVFVTMTQFFPLLGAAIYEMVTYQYRPAQVSIFIAINQCVTACLYNPTLFFYLNFELRQTLLKYVAHFLRNIGALGFVKTRILARTPLQKKYSVWSLPNFRSSQIFPDSLVSRTSNNEEGADIEANNALDDINTYFKIDIWLKDPFLLKAFQEQGRKDYAMENFLFFDDAKIYKTKGLAILTRFKTALVTADDNAPLPKELENDLEKLEKDWEDLETFFVKLYKLYVEIPSSPLEINIPFDKKQEIIAIYTGKDLSNNPSAKGVAKTVASSKSDGKSVQKRIFPLLSTLVDNKNNSQLIAEMEKYVDVYKDSYKIVKAIIASDIWPRYVKSELYYAAIEDHRKLHGRRNSLIKQSA